MVNQDTGATYVYQRQFVLLLWQSSHDRANRAETSAGTDVLACRVLVSSIGGFVRAGEVNCRPMKTRTTITTAAQINFFREMNTSSSHSSIEIQRAPGILSTVAMIV